MSRTKFEHGGVWVVKDGVRQNIDSLQDALAEEATCDACGCNAKLGFFTMMDLSDETNQLVFMYDQALYTILDSSGNRVLFAECCAERAAGTLGGDACLALVAAATPIDAPQIL